MPKKETTNAPVVSAQDVAAVETGKREFAIHTTLVEFTLQETTSAPCQNIQGWLRMEDASTLAMYHEDLCKTRATLTDGRLVRTHFDAIRYWLQTVRKNINS